MAIHLLSRLSFGMRICIIQMNEFRLKISGLAEAHRYSLVPLCLLQDVRDLYVFVHDDKEIPSSIPERVMSYFQDRRVRYAA